ncbi:hypothetical protein [Thioalbus denitrificans]|nr:hypothetical protein [Thioalbus denitrificans]
MVCTWIEKQGMSAHRFGRIWRFRKDDVDNLVKAGGVVDKTRQEQGE